MRNKLARFSSICLTTEPIWLTVMTLTHWLTTISAILLKKSMTETLPLGRTDFRRQFNIMESTLKSASELQQHKHQNPGRLYGGSTVVYQRWLHDLDKIRWASRKRNNVRTFGIKGATSIFRLFRIVVKCSEIYHGLCKHSVLSIRVRSLLQHAGCGLCLWWQVRI